MNKARLSATEERALAEAVARGDVQARERMILANLGLVYMIALRYLGRGLAMRDLVGEGNLGLIRAVDGFQPERGVRFSTYACKVIERAVREALTCNSMIHLPIDMVQLLAQWSIVERLLTRDFGKPPDAYLVAAYLGLTKEQRRRVLQAQVCRYFDPESDLLLAAIADEHESPDIIVAMQDQQQTLRRGLEQLMECLTSRQRIILTWRYGLDGEESLTYAEMGSRLKLTREWVRQIEQRAIRKLIAQENKCNLLTRAL